MQVLDGGEISLPDHCTQPSGTVDVVLSYCHNSLNYTSLLAELPYLSGKGVGVISASPLSMGLLTKVGAMVCIISVESLLRADSTFQTQPTYSKDLQPGTQHPRRCKRLPRKQPVGPMPWELTLPSSLLWKL